MAGIDGGVVGQAEQAFFDASDERLKVAARKVGAAYAAAEERVACEDPALNLSIEADTSFSVSGGTDDLQSAFTHLDAFTVFQEAVRQLAFAGAKQPEHRGMLLRMEEVVFHIGMSRHGDAVFPLDGGIAKDMVDVAVGVDDHQRLQPMAVDEAEELVLLVWGRAAGINDEALFGVVVINNVGVFGKRVENKGFKFEHSQLFGRKDSHFSLKFV